MNFHRLILSVYLNSCPYLVFHAAMNKYSNHFFKESVNDAEQKTNH